MKPPNKKNINGVDNETFKMLALLSHLGYSMVVPIVAGVLIGFKLDQMNESSPVFLLALTLLGAAVSVWSMLRFAKKFK